MASKETPRNALNRQPKRFFLTKVLTRGSLCLQLIRFLECLGSEDLQAEPLSGSASPRPWFRLMVTGFIKVGLGQIGLSLITN